MFSFPSRYPGRNWVAPFLALILAVVSVAVWTTSVAAQNDFQPASTVQLPVFGVAVDPDGVLQHMQFAPAGGELFFQRARVALAVLDQDLLRRSPLRKVSLRRLQEIIDQHAAAGDELPDEILKLAGLQRIEYVFAIPEKGDIIIAGPAEGWIENAGGRTVGITTGLPVVLLEDLAVAMRVFSQGQPLNTWVGCSIGSTMEGRRRLAELQRDLPKRVSKREEAELAWQIVPAIEEALGNATVSVFGIPGQSHMARVMLEADYRMKLIAIGREPPPIRMPVFFEKLKGAPKDNFQRWWFTPDYRCVLVSPDTMAMKLVGQGVKLGTEEYKTDGQGGLVQVKTQPLRAARLYAEAFTAKYEEISKASPVFAQLRNMIDALVVANFIQRHDLLSRTGLDLETLLDDSKVIATTQPAVSEARCLANAAWKGNKLVAPSGGVSVQAGNAFLKENSPNTKKGNRDSVSDPDWETLLDKVATGESEHWWWD